MADNDTAEYLQELEQRIQTLEETVELVCRPVARTLTSERIVAIERSAYEAQLKIAALEAEIAEMKGRTAGGSKAIADGRIRQVFARGRVFLGRILRH